MDHEHATDTELLRACRRGNERAASTLHARLAPVLRAIARSTLRDQHLAEDAVQRAFCQIMRAPRREVARVENAKAWLIRIVRNESASLARTLARARERDRRFSERRTHDREAGMDASRDAASAFAGGSLELAAAIDTLPEELREIVYLKHVAGLTFDQIEATTGMNRNTAASRHRRAVALLRETLAPGHPPGHPPDRPPDRAGMPASPSPKPSATLTNPEPRHVR